MTISERADLARSLLPQLKLKLRRCHLLYNRPDLKMPGLGQFPHLIGTGNGNKFILAFADDVIWIQLGKPKHYSRRELRYGSPALVDEVCALVESELGIRRTGDPTRGLDPPAT